MAGIPLQFDPELERYFIPTPQLLPATNFTAEEALAMIVMAHELGSTQQLPFFEPARSAALKLENALPRRLRDELHKTTSAIRIKTAPVSLAGERSYYDELVEATAARRAVRITYGSLAEGEDIRTKLRPYQLLFSRRSWYVIGHSSLHRETRTFHIGRIQKLDVLDERYQIPRGFSIERYLRNAWHLIPEPGPDVQITIRFKPTVARNVAEVAWHPTQTLHFNADGSLDFQVTVSGINEISWWILGYGDQAEVLEPPALREKVIQRAREMLASYNQSDTAPPSQPPSSQPEA